VEGRLKTDKWQDKQSGQDRYRVKVVADTVRFLGGGGAGAGAGRGAPRPPQEEGPPGGFEEPGEPSAGGSADDIPF
jgi:single-strand DNA-binding protein